MHILRATAQSSMLTQDMTDGIDHILRPFISRNQPYPAVIQIPHMPIPSVRSWPAPSNMLAIHFTRLATDGVHPVTRASTCPQDSSQARTAQLQITRRRSPKQLTSRRSKDKHQRLVGSPSNAAHLPTLGAGCTGKRPRHPVFTRVAGQYSLFGTGRFTNFRYWESLTRLLDYKVFINLRDLRFCLEKTSPT